MKNIWVNSKKLNNDLLSDIMTHLLDSWRRAMAMRILVRRKMMVRRMMASATEMIITEGWEEENEAHKQTHH